MAAPNPGVGRRHIPTVPKFSLLFPGPAGIALEDFCRHVKDAYSGLPAPHAFTHLVPFGTAGMDSIAGLGDPSPITLGALGDPGHIRDGVAALDHIHDTTALADLINLLQIDINIDGLAVSDPRAQATLAKILEQLEAIFALLDALVTALSRISMTPEPIAPSDPLVIASATDPQTLFAQDRSIRAGDIFNDSSAILYVLLGPGVVSNTNYHYKITAGSTLALRQGFNGPASGVWASVNGQAVVTLFRNSSR